MSNLRKTDNKSANVILELGNTGNRGERREFEGVGSKGFEQLQNNDERQVLLSEL
jgi:hypothetical protein